MKPTPTQIDLALSKTPFIPNDGNRAWMAEALSAAFSVTPAKALEWRLDEEGWHIADTFFGGYRVERNPHDHWCWGVFFHGEKGVGLNPADNFEAAKAAAQADFNERISSALDAKQAPDFRDMIIIGDTAYPVHSEVCRAFNELSAALSVPAAEEAETKS